MKFSLYLIASYVLLFTSCQKSNPDPSPDPKPPLAEQTTGNILKSTSLILSDKSFKDLTDNSITVIKSEGVQPKVGTILLGAPSASAPYGFLRKVISLNEGNGQIVCVTEQASLNEAFEQLSIDTTFSLSGVSDTTLRTNADFNITYSNNNSLIPGVKLNGVLRVFVPSVNLYYKLKSGSVYPEEFTVRADMSIGGELEATTSDELSINFPESILKSYPLPAVMVLIPVGPIVLPVYVSQRFNLKWKPLSIGGKMQLQFNPHINGRLGSSYKNGEWSSINSWTSKPAADQLDSDFFNVNAGMVASFTFVNPEYEIAPYNLDMYKLSLSVPQTLELTLQPKALTPNYSLKYKARIEGAVKSKIWLGDSKDYVLGFDWEDQVLFQGNWREDTLAILRSKTWKLNEPKKEYFGNFKCVDMPKTLGYTLENSTLTFAGNSAYTRATETKTGTCQYHCNTYTLDTVNCVMIKEAATTPSVTKNSMNVQIVNNRFVTSAHDSEAGELAWILVDAQIISFTKKRLVLRNAWYTGDLVYEAQ